MPTESQGFLFAPNLKTSPANQPPAKIISNATSSPKPEQRDLLREQDKPLENRIDGITTPSKVTPCIISY